jgi:hypothetical protein
MELVRLLDVFRVEEIPAIPFKGPVLSAQLYGDVLHRRCGDLDILIRETDVQRCAEVIRTQGYSPQMRLTWEWSFQRSRLENVDLHWSIMDKIHQFPFTTEQLWDRREVMTLCGTTVSALCMEDVLLALCFNGMKEGWTRFDRVRDIAAVMRQGKQIDWKRFLAFCSLSGCERIVLVGLYLANELFSASLPDELPTGSRLHRSAIRTSAWFRTALMNGESISAFHDDWTYLPRMRERLWEKLPYYQALAYSTFRPKTESKWRHVVRQGLYRSLRLLLLAVKKGLSALGHSGINK